MILHKLMASRWKGIFYLCAFTNLILAQAGTGVVIESIAPNQGLAKAGFKLGDLLLGWEGLEISQEHWQKGNFETIWDWHWFLVELAPRGQVTLVAHRENQRFTARLDPEMIRKDQIRPNFKPSTLALYQEGLAILAAGTTQIAPESWFHPNIPSDQQAWLALRVSQMWREKSLWEEQKSALELAHQKAKSQKAKLWILSKRSDRLWHRQLLDQADKVAGEWAELASGEPQSLMFAQCLNLLGNIAWTRGDFDLAEKHHRQALEIKHPLAPNSRSLADSYNNLGLIALNREQLDQAEAYHQKALAIRQVKVPDSTLLAASWLNLGIVSQYRGDRVKAETYFLKAVEITERHAPHSSSLTDALTNLGSLAWEKGQLEKAEHYHLRALELKKKFTPNSVTYSISLNNLGIINLSRGETEKAESFLQEARAIFEAKAPNSIWLADVLNNLGALAYNRSDLPKARDHFLHVMNIYQSTAPDSLALALSHVNLAGTALSLQDYDQAETSYSQALDIYSRKSPRSLEHGSTLTNLAILAEKLEHHKEALIFSNQAYEIIKEHVDAYSGGNRFTIFESSYRTHIGLLARQGKLAEAFQVLEDFRTFVLLHQLAAQKVLKGILPSQHAALKELGARYDRILNQQWQATGAVEKERLGRELLTIRVQVGDVKRNMVASSPTLIEYDESLDSIGALAGLSPGDLVLSFVFVEEQIVLFTLSKDQGINCFQLSITKEALVEKLKLLRLANGDIAQSRLMDVQKTISNQLYQALLDPVRESLDQAERLILIPDGPLWDVPFAALGIGSGANFQYLIEHKPLTTAASLTLYQRLKKRKKRDTIRIAAFGDPQFSDSHESHKRQASSTAAKPQKTALHPLPATRKEVRTIASLFPNTQTFLGTRATETHFKSLGSDITWLHVGSHAFFNPKTRDLQAGVYFSLPSKLKAGEDNGILENREIYNLELHLDLLVLSACKTALGIDGGGQGLLGLTRAFQFAGTRTMIASLWEVDDEATAILMKHLYHQLSKGKPFDEALRQAQISMIHQPPEANTWWDRLREKKPTDYSSPKFWAAFQLIGPH